MKTMCTSVYLKRAPHSSTLAWQIPWTEEPGRLQSMGSLESDTTERLHFHFSLSCIGEGNGNPLQCSCLEDPRDGEPVGLTESDTTKATWQQQQHQKKIKRKEILSIYTYVCIFMRKSSSATVLFVATSKFNFMMF